MRSRVLRAVVVLLFAACGGGTPRAPLSAKQSSPQTMMSFVPADSPYVFAQLDPMPQNVRDVMLYYSDQKLANALEMAKQIPADFDRSQLPVMGRLGLALVDELKHADMRHWGRDLGFDPSGRFALYGLSVWPVLRVGVADPAKLRGVVGRMIAAADLGSRIVEETRDGRRFWSFTAKGVTVVAAVLETEAVVAVVPTAAFGESLPILLGMRQPEHPLAETNQVADLVASHHFSKFMFGYVDLRRVTSILTGRGMGPLEAMLHSATGPISDVCKADLERLVEIAPRLVFGYHSFDTHGFRASIVAELAPSILRALQTLRTEVPEVIAGADSKAMMTIGAAFELDAMLPLAGAAIAWVKARPFQCEWLEPINKNLAQLEQEIGNPLPAAFQGFRGFSAVLEDIRKEPFDLTGSLLVASDRSPDLLAALQQMVPGMSGMTIVPDGRPVALPAMALGLDPNTQLHVGARADRIAVAVGRTSPDRVLELVHAKTPQHSPLLSFTFDVQRMQATGFFDDDEDRLDSDNMTSVGLQLDVKSDGLAFEVFGTFPKM